MGVIGWREWLALPELGIEPIKAKIDTGAKTSSLHAFGQRRFMDRGAPHVAFIVHPAQRRQDRSIECVAEIIDERVIKSSTGHGQKRLVIRTGIELGGTSWPVELTLANRDTMGFRMLLGRAAIRGRFVIDPTRSFIAGRAFADLNNISIRNRRKS